ncbi:MAG: hypothetical protein SFW63_01365 [Alphaproteobacteria bacterium]|nr:hypothetical protein [Alphaproteobacteria bacterium]
MGEDKKGYQTPGFLKNTSSDGKNNIKLVAVRPAKEDDIQYYIPTHDWRNADGTYMADHQKNDLVAMIRERLSADGISSEDNRDGARKIALDASTVTDDFLAAMRKENVLQEIVPWLSRTGNKTSSGMGPGF